MSRLLYIVEGEIEENFINQLKKMDLIKPGRVKKFNLMQKILKENDDVLTNRYDYVIGIIDTDCCGQSNCRVLSNNVKQLKFIGKVRIMIQNKNFEDELKNMLENNFGIYFNLKRNTVKDIKKYLAQDVSYQRCKRKDIFLRYCTKNDEFIQIYEENGYRFGKSMIISAPKIIK
jgi:hypothetical protein